MGRNKGQQKQMNYNRQSGGYQRNLYRQKMNAEGIKAPKQLDQKKLRIALIAIVAVWLIIGIILILNFKWKGFLAAVIIGALVAGGIYLFLKSKQDETIRYYKKIGMTEDMYIAELKRRNVDKKQLENYRKIWRKTKEK